MSDASPLNVRLLCRPARQSFFHMSRLNKPSATREMVPQHMAEFTTFEILTAMLTLMKTLTMIWTYDKARHCNLFRCIHLLPCITHSGAGGKHARFQLHTSTCMPERSAELNAASKAGKLMPSGGSTPASFSAMDTMVSTSASLRCHSNQMSQLHSPAR